MRVLIDTHIFLWWNSDDPSLSLLAKEIIADHRNEIFLSSASVWEIVIKVSKGRLLLPMPPDQYIPSRMRFYGFQLLPIYMYHALHILNLPSHHNDPFDRMLIAQSNTEDMPLITSDENIKQYQIETIW